MTQKKKNSAQSVLLYLVIALAEFPILASCSDKLGRWFKLRLSTSTTIDLH